MKQELAIKESVPTSSRCLAAESSIRDTIPSHPSCSVGGCTEEPMLARDVPGRGYVFFCDKHRPDKKREYQRDANWRHKLKTKYGIIMPRRDNHAKSA